MNYEQTIHGISKAEIHALRIPRSYQNQCLKQAIAYKRCRLNQSILSQRYFGSCEDEKRDLSLCYDPIALRQSGVGAMMLKKNDPQRFDAQKIAPSVSHHYDPTFMDAHLHR